jgi:hypothetical protein
MNLLRRFRIGRRLDREIVGSRGGRARSDPGKEAAARRFLLELRIEG